MRHSGGESREPSLAATSWSSSAGSHATAKAPPTPDRWPIGSLGASPAIFPYLDLSEGLSSRKMKDLGWFSDNIHLTPQGGKAIGDGISRLLSP